MKHQSKLCRQCDSLKGLRLFYKHPTTADRYLPACKECHRDNVYENRQLKKWAKQQ